MRTVAVIFAVSLVYYVVQALVRRSPSAPPPDGLEPDEQLIKSTAAWAKIDGMSPEGNGYAYLTDRRLVWTPRMDAWQVRNLRPGLPYTLPVEVSFPHVRRVSTPFYLGGSKLRVESEAVVIVLEVKGRSFRSWRKWIEGKSHGLLDHGQEVPRASRADMRSEYFRASRPNRISIAVGASLLGLFSLSRLLAVNTLGLSGEELVALLLGCLGLCGVYVLWSGRDQT
jgi:hypothetical protein